MLLEVGSDEEGAHAVAHHHIGHAGVFLLHHAAQGVDVFDHVLPAVLLSEIAVILRLGGEAVADVVFAADQHAETVQIFGKRPVAGDVIAHPVDDLQYAYRLNFGLPDLVMDGAAPVSALVRSFCFHR